MHPGNGGSRKSGPSFVFVAYDVAMEFILFAILTVFLGMVFTGVVLSEPEPVQHNPQSTQQKHPVTECKNCGAKEVSTVCSYCASPK